MTSRLEQHCLDRGLRLSGRRRVVLRVLDEATDHPCAEEIHDRAVALDPEISLATVYRTLNMLAKAGLLSRLALGDHRTRYEEAGPEHHEHLIDVQTGQVREFRDEGIEALVRQVAAELGYRLIDYRLELFAEQEAPVSRPAAGPSSPRSRIRNDARALRSTSGRTVGSRLIGGRTGTAL